MKNLIPTVVTDKNGRTTTVHKRHNNDVKAAKALRGAVPSIAVQEAAESPTRTPIKHPAPLTSAEVTAFDDKYHESFSKPPYDRQQTSRGVFVHMLDGVMQAHIRRVVEEGTVDQDALDRMLIDYREDIRSRQRLAFSTPIAKERATATLLATILVSERIGKEHPHLYSEDGTAFSSFMRRVVIGTIYETKIADRSPFIGLRTEEDLAATTAVAAVMINEHSRSGYSTDLFNFSVFKDSAGNENHGNYLTNRTLNDFLQGYPEEVNRVIKYLNTREFGRTAKDTKAMIKFLDESRDLGAVSDGWL